MLRVTGERCWIAPKTTATGSVPPGSYEHASFIYTQGQQTYLYVYGGSTENGLSNELHRLDLRQMLWERIHHLPRGPLTPGECMSLGVLPSPRASLHTCACFVSERGTLYIVGGSQEGNVAVESMTLTSLDCNGA